MNYYIGIDLGGTNIVAGVVDKDYKIIAKESMPTQATRSAELVIADMIEASKKAVEKANISLDDVAWVGVGSPGTVNKDTGVIEYSANLFWDNVELGKMLEAGLHKKIFLANDANAAAYGEFVAGVGKDSKCLVAITLGTGVGGGVIIDGKILTGSNFAGAELGHTVIVAHGRHCNCGREGCFEAYASATGLINLTKETMLEDKDSAMWKICGGDIESVNGKTAFDGMREKDMSATKVVDTYIDYLSIGISDMINIFQPEILCIGGGICKERDTLMKPLRALVEKNDYIKDPAKRTKLMVAQLGNDAGVIGAALLGLEG